MPNESSPVDEPTSSWVDLLGVAAIPRRMAVLSTLRRCGGLSIADLATRVAARVHDVPLADVAEEQYDDAMTELHHVHLPALVAGGLTVVSGDDDSRWIRPGPSFDPDHVERIEALVDRGTVDATIASALAERRRRRAVSVLSTMEGPVGVDVLAEALIAGTRPSSEGAFDETCHDGLVDSFEALRVHLHHCDLPKLADAGVVEYRTDEHLVSYRGLPAPIEVSVVGG